MALTTQTATDLRGICGNDRLKKCWKANRTEQKRPQTNGKNHKKFQIPLGKDEVASSNLAISSKNRFSFEKRFFLLPAARVHGMPGGARDPAAERQKSHLLKADGFLFGRDG